MFLDGFPGQARPRTRVHFKELCPQVLIEHQKFPESRRLPSVEKANR